MHFHWSLIPAVILAGVWLRRTYHAFHTVISTPTLYPSAQPRRGGTSTVSILVPARNEEKNIGICIRSLLTQIGPHDEIIIVNDRSTDGTEMILKSLGAELIQNQEPRSEPRHNLQTLTAQLRYLNLSETDTSWTGKNYALAKAIPFARGEWLLFTDADTEHYPGSLAASVQYAEQNKIDYLTLWPQCITKSFWEHVVQICSFSYIGLWFPTPKANDPNSDLYFANGQYSLLSRQNYEKIGGHAAVKAAFLEDFAMMRRTKESGGRGIVGIGTSMYGTHMYEGLRQIWKGWRRIYLHGFERRPFQIWLKSAELFAFSVFPFLICPLIFWAAFKFPAQYFWTAIIWGFALINILAIAWKASGVIGAKRAYSFLHGVGAFILALILIDATHMAVTGKKTVWR